MGHLNTQFGAYCLTFIFVNMADTMSLPAKLNYVEFGERSEHVDRENADEMYLTISVKGTKLLYFEIFTILGIHQILRYKQSVCQIMLMNYLKQIQKYLLVFYADSVFCL